MFIFYAMRSVVHRMYSMARPDAFQLLKMIRFNAGFFNETVQVLPLDAGFFGGLADIAVIFPKQVRDIAAVKLSERGFPGILERHPADLLIHGDIARVLGFQKDALFFIRSSRQRSFFVRTSPRHKITARSMIFSSSRTLPA
jgi:hypothetical protein